MKKVSDLVVLSEEMLSADVMLPNLVAIINSPDFLTLSGKNDIQMKLVALETLSQLIEGCQHLN